MNISKAKVGFTYVYSAAFAHTAFIGAVVTEPPFSLGVARLSPHTRTLTCAVIQPHIVLVCRLNGLYPHNPCNPCKYMD